MTSAGILDGLRIVEISAFVAAPLAGATLAAMGADVIRVEQLGGGIDARRWPVHDGRSLYREGLDRGKRSVGVDLRSPRGQALATRLIASRGILLTNLGGSGWLSYERLTAARPDLIMVLITGTHDGGAAVDYTVNAGVGFPLVTGPEDAKGPINHVLPAWDLATGYLAVSAILAAERHRTLTGSGQLVRLALTDVALGVAGHLGLLAEAALEDLPRQRYGNAVYGTFGRDFRSRDGRFVMVCALTRRQWASLGLATGLTSAFAALEAHHGVDLGDEGERFRLRHAICTLIEAWVAERSEAEVAAAFDANDVLWGPYRSFKEVVEDGTRPHASPIDFGAFERASDLASPRIGSDTADVLASDLGLDATDVEELRDQHVID